MMKCSLRRAAYYQISVLTFILAIVSAIKQTGAIAGASGWIIENSALVAGNDVRSYGNYTIEQVIARESPSVHLAVMATMLSVGGEHL